MPEPTLTIDSRYCGPPQSGNGGWTAGALVAAAKHLVAGPAEVSLRRPPPLDRTLVVRAAEEGADLLDVDDTGVEHLVARVRAADADPEPVLPVSLHEASVAETRYPGLDGHPFPTCYVCGPDRADGMRIFPGPVPTIGGGGTRVAATWTPDAAAISDHGVAETWAALDCAGGWAGDLEERLMVLASMRVRLHALPEPGLAHVVVGEARGEEGRKTWTATSLYSPDGALLGSAAQLWITIDPSTFGGTP